MPMRRALPLLAVLLAGCVPLSEAGLATATLLSTAPSVPPTPTAPSARSPEPPPRAACLSEAGRIETGELVEESLPRSIPFRVYLPACVVDPDFRPLPVLILLHGLQLTDSQWDDLGVDETADRLILAGRIPPLVIAMPWERKGLEFESAVVDHLLPAIRSEYAGPGGRRRTAIGGISRGAGWAFRIGFKHPSEFIAVGLHSPAILVPDLYSLPEWVAQAGTRIPRLWIDIAERDTSKAGALELAAGLDDLGLDYVWSTAPGEHSAAYWSSRMEDYLLWYADQWTLPGN